MFKLIKKIICASCLFISVTGVANAIPLFIVQPNLTAVTLVPNGSANIDFTVTNNSGVTQTITQIKPSQGTGVYQSSVTNEDCIGATLTHGANCTVNTTVTALEKSGTRLFDISACAFNGGVCSGAKTKITVKVGGQSASGCTGPNGACKVFATEATFFGDLSPGNAAGHDFSSCNLPNTEPASLAKANCICQVEGATHSIGKWRAWLSNDTTHAKDNIGFTPSSVYVRATEDNAVIAEAGALTSPPLSLSVKGLTAIVWTGTNDAGELGPPGPPATTTCENWTTGGSGPRGLQGDPVAVNSRWTLTTAGDCAAGLDAGLYCFEMK